MMKRRKFEWKPGWTEVKERVIEPSSCATRQYRRANIKAGVDAIYCCPKGYHFDEMGDFGCMKGDRIKKPKLQALRHKVASFKRRHPQAWKELQAKSGKGKRRVLEMSK